MLRGTITLADRSAVLRIRKRDDDASWGVDWDRIALPGAGRGAQRRRRGEVFSGWRPIAADHPTLV